MMSNFKKILVFVALAGLGAACGGQASNIPGTRLPDSAENRAIIERVEEYRLAVERKDAAALTLMASTQYWEDGGTPTGGDDYGYDRLREVLASRFQQAEDIRYSMRYVDIKKACPDQEDGELREGCRAYVDVLIDASYTVDNARGEPVRQDKRDQNQLVLEYDGEKWKFLSGM